MMDEKTSKLANELFDKAHSHLEAPLIGEIFTPLCLSCTNIIDSSDMAFPRCKEYGDIPNDIRLAESDDCPHYKMVPNCPAHNLPKIERIKRPRM